MVFFLSSSVTDYLSYEAITNVTNNILLNKNEVLNGAMLASKSLAVLFILLTWIKNYLEALKNPGKGTGLTLYHIVIGVAYILLVANFDVISDKVDEGLAAYEEHFNLQTTSNIYSYTESWVEEMENEVIRDEEEKGFLGRAWDKVTGIVTTAVDIVSNFGDIWWWLFLLMKAIAWFVNVIVYPIFLLERGFLLLIMKFALPLILALGALKSYRKLVTKWVALYCAIFLTGLFFILATQFCDEAFGKIVNNHSLMNSNDSKAIVFIVIAFGKVKLYKGAKDLAEKLF